MSYNDYKSILINNLYTLTNESEKLAFTVPALNMDLKYNDLIIIFNKILDTNDFVSILQFESLIIQYTITYDCNSTEENNSWNTGFQEANSTLKVYDLLINDSETYNKAFSGTLRKKNYDSDGLPIDGARGFFRSHMARLENKLGGKGSIIYKNFLRQRQANLKALEDIYRSKQKEIFPVSLDLPKKNKSKRSLLNP